MNDCQISQVQHHSFLVSPWSFQPILGYAYHTVVTHFQFESHANLLSEWYRLKMKGKLCAQYSDLASEDDSISNWLERGEIVN